MRYSADSEDDLPKIEAARIESKLENKSEIIQKANTIIEDMALYDRYPIKVFHKYIEKTLITGIKIIE